jgi:hypothetical protein
MSVKIVEYVNTVLYQVLSNPVPVINTGTIKQHPIRGPRGLVQSRCYPKKQLLY